MSCNVIDTDGESVLMIYLSIPNFEYDFVEPWYYVNAIDPILSHCVPENQFELIINLWGHGIMSMLSIQSRVIFRAPDTSGPGVPNIETYVAATVRKQSFTLFPSVRMPPLRRVAPAPPPPPPPPPPPTILPFTPLSPLEEELIDIAIRLYAAMRLFEALDGAVDHKFFTECIVEELVRVQLIGITCANMWCIA